LGELIEKIKTANFGKYIILSGILTEQDLPSRMNDAKFVVIPSRIESIPLVLGQAANYAKSILLTDVGDMGHLARKYGIKNLCQPNVLSLEEELLNAINNSESKKSTNLTNLSNFLSLDNSVLNYLKMIQTEVG
jgi:glycosyltransferase involved in cell wall biosynthesis